MILRLLLLLTSFTSAVGNYGFLAGLENQPDYMFYLSFSSCFSGAFCYGFLPAFTAKYPPRVVSAIIAALWVTGCTVFFVLLSVSAVLVVSTIFLFLCAEMILAASGHWTRIYILRALMLMTGVLSWIAPDFAAISTRAAIVGLASAFYIIESSYSRVWRAEVSPSQRTLLLLVATNLTWVYLLPLILVGAAGAGQKLSIYMITTLVPLIYFKAQDAVFKVDIVGKAHAGKASALIFLALFAVPLVLFYASFPLLQIRGLILIPFTTVISYTVSSITLLIFNIYLTNSLSNAKKYGGKSD